jgi:hypothetical protein
LNAAAKIRDDEPVPDADRWTRQQQPDEVSAKLIELRRKPWG